MAYNTITRTFDGVATTHMQCWCGISFAIPATLYDHYVRENDRGNKYNLFCPLGHSMIPAGKSEAEKLRDQLAAEKHWREQAESRVQDLRATVKHQDSRINGYKGVVARTKKKIAAGRCPCCSHEFKNLKSHMRTQHPHYNPEKGAEALAEKSAARGVGQ